MVIKEEILFLRDKNSKLKSKIRELNKIIKEMKENEVFLINRLDVEKQLKQQYRNANFGELVINKKMNEIEQEIVKQTEQKP
tara:strand:- start:163 stop:408 length:246 start_codon:yes stop_codon:yes gene_type:complete